MSREDWPIYTWNDTPPDVPVGFLPGEAEGAIPNGTPIVKVASESGDGHPIGTKGTVIASHAFTDEMYAMVLRDDPHARRVAYLYFVTWADAPKIPVGCADWKIAEAP